MGLALSPFVHPITSGYSIRARLILLVGLTVLPAIALISYSAWEQRTQAAADAQDAAAQLLNAASHTHQGLIESTGQLLATLSRLSEVRNRKSGSCSSLFGEILKVHPVYANIGAVDLKGDIYCSAVPLAEPVNVSDRAYFTKVIGTGAFATGDYQIGRITGKPVLVAAHPVTDSRGTIAGLVFAGLELGWLNRFLSQGDLPPGANLTVIDRNATVLARYPDFENWIGRSVAGTAVAQQVLGKRKGRGESIGLDGIERLYAFTPLHGVSGQGGILMWASIPRHVAFVDVNQALIRNIITLGLLALVMTLIAWSVSSRSIILPVSVLVDAAKKIGSGDFSARATVGSTTGELGQLGAQFNKMAESLDRRYQELRTLRAIDLGILSTLELSPTLDILLERIDEHLPYAATTIRIHNRETGQLELVAWRNLDAEQLLTKDKMGLEALPHSVFKKQAPLAVLNIQSEVMTDDREVLLGEGFKSYLGVPLAAKNEPIGVLSFYTKEEHRFSDYEVEFLTIVAGQASIAIDNSLLYERTKRQASELAVANSIKDEFLNIVSHELRTPINVISGYATLLDDKSANNVDEVQKKAVDAIHRCTINLLATIESIMEATQIQAGAAAVAKDGFEINEFFEQLKSFYETPLQKPVALKWDFEGAPRTIRTDRQKLSRILVHLINNATKFTETGTITVSARYEPSIKAVKFVVEDTGIGMSSEAQRIMFEKFRQADSSKSRGYEGVGLGLYIVKQYVDMLGAEIQVQSEIGKGSKFMVIVPEEHNKAVCRVRKNDERVFHPEL